MASGIGGHSTTFASMIRHSAPKAAEPSGVIRSTTCTGGRSGAIARAGAGGGAAAMLSASLGGISLSSTASNLKVGSLLVQRVDQTVNAAGAQDGRELRPVRRQLADRAGKVDIANLPGHVVVVHHIVDRHRLAVCLDDLGLDQIAVLDLLLAEHLKLFPGVGIEAARVDRSDVAAVGLHGPPLLFGREPRP